MVRKMIITKQETLDDTQIITTLFEQDKAVEINVYHAEQQPVLGNIYIGRVKNIAKHIGAAFIDIGKGQTCYYSLKDCKRPLYTKKIGAAELVAGDELLVQVSRDAIKTKPPTVSANLNFAGKYMVLTTGKKTIGISAKITGNDRERLKAFVASQDTKGYGFIVRTNAGSATEEELSGEMQRLIRQCEELKERAPFRSCYSVVWEMASPWLSALRDINSCGLSGIVTDDRALYDEIYSYLSENQPEDLAQLSFYDDHLLPLTQLYNISGIVRDALKERVWLKSGAYLVIQPTEALTVVDVNTGKYEGKKKQQDTFLKINLEASKEIARQLRLRNISGIIIVDFINMESSEHKQELLDALTGYLHKDSVRTVLVDMTPLNLVEITRQKKKKPLSEQING